MKYRQLKAGPVLFHSQLKSCCLSETIEATKASKRAPPSLSSLSLPPRRLSLAAPTKKRPTPERREEEKTDSATGLIMPAPPAKFNALLPVWDEACTRCSGRAMVFIFPWFIKCRWNNAALRKENVMSCIDPNVRICVTHHLNMCTLYTNYLPNM